MNRSVNAHGGTFVFLFEKWCCYHQGGNVLLNCMLRYFKHEITSIFYEACINDAPISAICVLSLSVITALKNYNAIIKYILLFHNSAFLPPPSLSLSFYILPAKLYNARKRIN